MTFEIYDADNGEYVDIVPFIAKGGLKWQRSDVDGPGAGRNLDNAELIRDRIAIKYRWDVTCRPLTSAEQALILRLIEPEFITVRYFDPPSNAVKTGVFYSNNFPTSYAFRGLDGTDWWTGLTFPVIMR